VRRTIEPLLHTRYSMTFSISYSVENEIFSLCSSYQEWLYRWAMNLLSHIKDEEDRQVLITFRALIRSDQAIVKTIIIATISRLLRKDDHIQEYLTNELLSLLKHGRILLESQNEKDRTSFIPFFRLLFFLDDYLREWRSNLKKLSHKCLSTELQVALTALENLDKSLDPYDFACCSILCEDYQRAVYYLEKCVSRNASPKPTIQFNRLLQICYAGLNDIDGMEGIVAQIQTKDIGSAILEYETKRNWDAALSCYEVRLRYDTDNTRYQCGYLRCLRNLGRLNAVMKHALCIRNGKLSDIANSFLLEAAWRLKAWTIIDKELLYRQPMSFDDDIGLLLKDIRNADSISLNKDILEAKKRVWKVLSSKVHLGETVTQKAMVQLHMLHDIDSFIHDQNRFLDQATWCERLNRTNCSIATREPIIHLRRIMLELM
jgi:serine/threonine-protein kinase ATR